MNKNLYRIVFNKARGLLMVVADIAASGRAASSPSSGIGHTQRRRLSTLSPLSFSLLLAFGCVSLSAQATIVADASAPGNQQPTIINSANGTPQVNIQTPSSGGVSRNVYSQFDVDNRGVILNNGQGVNQTQLGGFVSGNPSLARGEASIILNEVNSRDPSRLNGYIEVAGRKAQVVIANPSGITCEGCGFINANRATLTTGQAQLNNGQLTGYDVDRGEIVIQGKGLDSSRQDHTDLIARSVKVNAGIWANDLKVTAGRNQVDAAHRNITAKAADGSARPTVAVDVASLGGMYAGKIRLIGTESGVGVRNAGEIGASAGDITITADGMLVNSGQINSAQHLAVKTTTGIANAGVLYAQGNTQLTTAGTLSNTGTVAAAGDTTLRAAEVNSSRNSVLGAGVKSDNSSVTSGTLSIEANGQLIAQGKNISGTAQNLNAHNIDLSGSQIQSRDITLTTQGGAIDLSGANLSASQHLSASTAAQLRTDSARLIADQVTLNAQSLANVGGVIAQTGTMDFNLNLPGDIDNRGGTLLSGGKLSLQAESLNSNGNSLLGAGVQSDGRLTDVGDLMVTTRQDLIAHGQTLAAGAMTLTGSRVNLADSHTQAREMNIIANSGDISTQRANILSLGSLTITAGANAGQTLNNQGGALAANNIALNLGQLDNNAGKVTASQDLTLGLQNDFNNLAGSTLQAGRDLTLSTDGALTNDGQLVAGGKLSTHSASLLNNGNISATQASLTATGALTNRGEILTRGRLDTDTNTLFNTGSLISAEATLKARERITNSGPNALMGATDENGTLALLAPVIENSDTVTHTDSAPTTTLLGMGKVILAGGQDNGGNYLTAAQILNISGLIESGKDMLIYATTLTNRRHILTANTQFVTGNTVSGSAYWSPTNPDVPGGRYAEPPHGGSMNSDYIGTNYTSTYAHNSIDKISPEAHLLTGGNLTPQVGTLENFWSKISAQGEISLSGVALQQDGWGNAQRLIERTTSSGEWRYRTYKGNLWGTGWGPEVKEHATNQYASSLTAKTISGSGTTINNGANPGSIAPPDGRDHTGKDIAIEFNGISLTQPNGGLYKFNTDYTVGGGGYLIETNPAFANLNNWRGSDYVLQQLNNNPAFIHKRLGDNAYEQRLVRDQVLALTGQAVASGYTSAQEQFEQLFAAGLEYSKAFNLALGTHLSAEQMAALTRNIVLMESRDVAGQTVLVPVVYLAGVKPGDLQANGALIAANNIELTDMQGLTNQGAIKANNDLRINMAKDITLTSNGGLLQAGGNMQLSTLNSDIDLTGTRLNATNLQLDSGRDVVLRTDSEQLSSSNGAVLRNQTILGPLASINVSNNAVINTDRDFILQGASVNVGKDLQVNTGGDWILNTVERSDQISADYGYGHATSEHIRHLSSEVNVGGALAAKVDNLTAVGANINAGTLDVQAQNINLSAATDSLQVTGKAVTKRHSDSVDLYDETLLGSQLNAKGDINLQAAKDIKLSASTVETDGALKLAAGGDVTLTTQTEQHDELRIHTGKHKGLASSSTTHTEDSRSQTLAVGSMLSAGSINVSGNNIAVTGSNVVADNDINLRAKENLTVSTAQQSESESHLYEKKKSGLMGTGGIGVTVGSNSQKTTDTGKSLSNVGSTVGSVGGNVSMTAGKDLTVQGSDVLAGKDIALTGKNVAIVAAENQLSQTHTVEQKQSGLTLALSGTVGSAVNTAVTTAKAASEESNGRLAALQGVKAALSGVQAVQGGQLAAVNASDQNAIGISLSYGSQSSKSEQTVNQTTHQGSTLTAGNNLNITATGNGVKGADGDIVLQGSQLQAGKDTSLTANRDVILQSTQESQTLDGSNKSSGGSLGIGIGAGQGGWGINISASLNKGKGSESGNGVTHTETTVNAGNQLNITSGRDTVLQGAQVSGETVKVDVGRDLLLQSQQDSDRYDSKQQDASVGGSFNFGSMTGNASINASRDKMHSNFDSVQEQTGIFAGKGGFDVKVGEHTQLDGAVIASTAIADKNTLDTGTLGFSDIGNKADFKVEHQSVGISTGGSIGGQFAGNMANGLLVGANNEGHADSTTHAAVSDGTITVRDTDKQQQNVDNLSRDAEHANNALSPIFDKEKEQNRLKEAQLIGEIGSQVSDVVRTQGDINSLKAAQKELGPLKENATEKDRTDYMEKLRNSNFYKDEMKKYGTGSALQQGIQAATAAVQGLAGGDMAKALAGGSAPYLAEVIHNMTTDPVTGKVNTEANLMAHAVLGAVVAQVNGNSALAGASGAVMGEYIAQKMYPGINREDLTEEQRQTISALGTLAAGLAGGLAGGSTADAVAGAQAGKNAVENNYLSVSEKTELELAKQTLQNSKDPTEREKAQQKYDALREKDIASDKEVIDACGNGKAGSAACASARLDVIVAKGEYETGEYNNKVSQMYPDAYGQIVNLLNITSVDAQSQQQVKDAMVNYAMVQLGVDKTTAEAYVETYEGMKILSASLTPVIGVPAAKQLSKIVDANLKVVAKGNVDGNKFSDTNQGVRPSQLADFNKPTLINDVVQAKIDKRPDKNYPNGNMGTAHAEVGVIQQAFDKGMTQGREMAMSVAGKEVCNYCLSDVRAMAEKAGLKSLTIYEEATGNVLFWQQGMNKIENRGPAK
ncbi:hemagglutinin repeat-containing protein [Yersinia intermedia]|uniref:hemagglutinin repeat-containing protein n=2 Tax=Yersinia intermedia TaxID=631 RepID=UPI001CFF209C|nr:hemagglutinin repeat-containing protein [Yersinia intermedia]MCB5321722.1 hemagglutinin repeat-containing protein [Yersinia intermedia]